MIVLSNAYTIPFLAVHEDVLRLHKKFCIDNNQLAEEFTGLWVVLTTHKPEQY